MRQEKHPPLASEAIGNGYREHPQAAAGSRPVGAFDRAILRLYAHLLGKPPVALSLWDGSDAWRPARGKPLGRVIFHDRAALLGVLLAPEMGFGDGVSAGRIEIQGNVVEVLHQSFRCWHTSPLGLLRRSFLSRLPQPWRGSPGDARRNIHYHYDLGNDFYRLWLDERMVYTCAYYPEPGLSLEAAQVAKLDLVCRKLGLRPGMRVAEAGCGWGALALHMAEHYGVRVRAWNISSEQVCFARDRARELGLHSRIEFIEDDYRSIAGQFDAFVSIGMLEHVGPENYRDFGAVIDRCLGADGIGLLHTIGRDQRAVLNAWTTRRIFPGSHAPSLREIMDILEPNRFSVLDVENLRLHYAQTTLDWLERFEAQLPRIRDMYDDTFVRAWHLYLASSAAAFLAGNLQLFQVLFARGGANWLPRSRAHFFGQRAAVPWQWN